MQGASRTLVNRREIERRRSRVKVPGPALPGLDIKVGAAQTEQRLNPRPDVGGVLRQEQVGEVIGANAE